jgi:hypothetical protein
MRRTYYNADTERKETRPSTLLVGCLLCCFCLALTTMLVVLLVETNETPTPTPTPTTTPAPNGQCSFFVNSHLQPPATFQPIVSGADCGQKAFGSCTATDQFVRCAISFHTEGEDETDPVTTTSCPITAALCVDSTCSCPGIVLCQRNVNSGPAAGIQTFLCTNAAPGSIEK